MTLQRSSLKKVLVVSTNADWAGAPIHVLTLVSALKMEFDFFVVFGQDGPVRQALMARGIPCEVVPTLRSSIHPVRDFRSFWAFLKIVQAQRPDIIHAHSSKAGMVGRMAAWIKALPCLYTVHGWGFGSGRARLQSALVYCVERLLSTIAGTTYIFVAHADQMVGLEQLKLKPDQCLTIHNGMPDHGFYANPASTASVIMAARVCHQKDHDSLLRAIESCQGSIQLVLVGDGTDSAEFRNRVQTIAPSKQAYVRCLGVSEKVPELLSQAGIFVLTSRYEGLPLSIIEAMCAGLPIVATDVGGVRELVEDGVNGFLVTVGDTTRLSQCLERLQRDASLRVLMGRASRERYLADFSDKKMATTVASKYRSMTEVV